MWSVAGQAPALVEPTEQCAWLAVGGVPPASPPATHTSASLLVGVSFPGLLCVVSGLPDRQQI